MSQAEEAEQVASGAVIKDLSWFSSIFFLVAAGPSILSILQAVFVEHRLGPAFQWIVDGYNSLLAVVGAIIEPLIQPAIDWLNQTFDWSLALQPHWRPLFVLMTLLPTAFARTLRGPGELKWIQLVPMVIGSLLGALAAGLAPLSGGWWVQGLSAAAPLAGVLVIAGAVNLAGQVKPQAPRASEKKRRGKNPSLAIVSWLFVSGAALSFVPGLERGAGMLTLAAAVALLGAVFVVMGVFMARVGPEPDTKSARMVTRVGLTVLGGFITAGAIVAVDAFLR